MARPRIMSRSTTTSSEYSPAEDSALQRSLNDGFELSDYEKIDDHGVSRRDSLNFPAQSALHEPSTSLDSSPPTVINSRGEFTTSNETDADRGILNSGPAGVLESHEEGRDEDGQERRLGKPEWHPFWLHPAIFGVFGVLFVCIMAISVFLGVYSKANDGLANAHDNLAYVWRFGPTACKP